MKKKNIRKIIMLVLTGVLICGCCYVNDYYHALDSEIEEFETENAVSVDLLKGDVIVCAPEEPVAGMIFYPGGKVEYTSYIPLMKECASNGIMTVLVKMPFNLAVLDVNAADGITEKYPEIKEWYMAGHSLGGSMAATYIENNTNEYDGLVLLGSYSTSDIKDLELKVLSIYGSEDLVMKRDNYEENRKNLPDDLREEKLEGGNHAGFGMYGMQEGDGVSTITNEEQIRKTANIIFDFICD